MLWFGASREGDFAWSGTGDAPGTFQEVPATQEIKEKDLLETDCFNKRLNFRTSLLSFFL